MITIERAQQNDLSAILSLLGENHLPLDGLADHIPTALVARSDGQIVGSAALEVYGTTALLRSVSVSPTLQKKGLGQQLTRAALDMAQQQGIDQVYLLTETAKDFFPRFGFKAIERTAVPPAVRESVEFTTACPESALAMALHIR